MAQTLPLEDQIAGPNKSNERAASVSSGWPRQGASSRPAHVSLDGCLDATAASAGGPRWGCPRTYELDDGRPPVPPEHGGFPGFPAGMSEDLVDEQVS